MASRSISLCRFLVCVSYTNTQDFQDFLSPGVSSHLFISFSNSAVYLFLASQFWIPFTTLSRALFQSFPGPPAGSSSRVLPPETSSSRGWVSHLYSPRGLLFPDNFLQLSVLKIMSALQYHPSPLHLNVICRLQCSLLELSASSSC